MKIRVNSEIREVDQTSTIKLLLNEQNISEFNGIAVAVNEEIIRKEIWETFTFSENDNVIIIKATRGG